MTTNKYIGSSFDDFLKEEVFDCESCVKGNVFTKVKTDHGQCHISKEEKANDVESRIRKTIE